MKGFLLALCVLLCACSPCERLSKKCPPVKAVSDTLIINHYEIETRVEKDSTAFLSLQKEYLQLMADLSDTIMAENSFCTASAYNDFERKGLCLTLSSKDSALLPVKHLVLHKYVSDTVYVTKNKSNTFYIPKMNSFQKTFFWIGVIATLVAIVRFSYRLWKKF